MFTPVVVADDAVDLLGSLRGLKGFPFLDKEFVEGIFVAKRSAATVLFKKFLVFVAAGPVMVPTAVVAFLEFRDPWIHRLPIGVSWPSARRAKAEARLTWSAEAISCPRGGVFPWVLVEQGH